MSSGNRQMVYNFRERLVSTDHVREQQFIGGDLATVFAHLFLATSDADVGAGATETLSATTDTPLTAAVLDGLRASPINGTVNLLITPGVLVMSNPDLSPSPDDVPQKWVCDPGVQLVGALTMTPGGGSTRVDVVECSRTSVVLESDNRDVFDPTTGLFSPVLLDKVVAGQLAYRIRIGTPGAGYPGHAAGWLPLAVCSVPSSATNWDGVTIWDVRPLVSDRRRAPFASSRSSLPVQSRTRVHTDTTTSAGHQRVYGQIDAELGAYQAGGRIQTDAGAYLDLSDAQLPEAGYVLPGSPSAPGFWNLWLLFPFGLPRWVRYAGPSAGARTPTGLRGIPVLSLAAARFDGTPVSTGPSLPGWTGLGGSVTQKQAILVLSGYTSIASSPVPLGVTVDGEVATPSDPLYDFGTVFTGINPLTPTVASDFSSLTWTNQFVDGVTHPANAKAIYVVVGLQELTGSMWTHVSGDFTFGCYFHFQVSGPDGSLSNAALALDENAVELVTKTNAYHTTQADPKWVRVVRVPLAPNLANPTTPRQFTLVWHCNLGTALPGYGVLVSNPEADVIGWEVGP